MVLDVVNDDHPGGDQPCVCGVDVDDLELPGLSDLASCPHGCVDGAVLAGHLTTLDPSQLLSDGDALDLVVAWDRVTAWSQARGLRAVAEFARRPDRRVSADPIIQRASRIPVGDVARPHAGDELAAALSLSVRTGDGRLSTACTAVRLLPRSLAALGAGRIDLARLNVLVEEVGVCGPEAADVVERHVLSGGRGASASEFRRRARAAVVRHDAEAARRRAEDARKRAYVRTRPADVDTAWLEAYMPAEDAAAVRTALDAAAVAMRREGDERSFDRLRAVALAAPFWTALTTGLLATPEGPLALSLLGGEAPALVLTLDVTGQAELGGLGPVTPALRRELAARARPGRRVVVREVDAIDLPAAARIAAQWPVEPSYRPSAALRRHVRQRDESCRYPGCAMPAVRCDGDHTRPWPHGPTHPSNLATLCRRHHRFKQSRTVSLVQPEPGVLEWTTPTGHRFTTRDPGLGARGRRRRCGA